MTLGRRVVTVIEAACSHSTCGRRRDVYSHEADSLRGAVNFLQEEGWSFTFGGEAPSAYCPDHRSYGAYGQKGENNG